MASQSTVSRTWVLLLTLGMALVLAAWWTWQEHAPVDRATAGDTGVKKSDAPIESPSPSSKRAITAKTRRRGLKTRHTQPHVGGDATLAPNQTTVSGRVSGPDGTTPVAGVDVIFTSKGAESTATSDTAGAYSLQLVAGAYQVRAVGDRVMAIGLRPLRLASSSRRYDIRVQQHSVVRGQVRYPNGSPAAGASVVPQLAGPSVSLSSARGELGTAAVQDDGSFELFTVHGNLRLNVSSASASGSAVVRALRPGEERAGIKIVLVPNGYLEGVVRGPTGKAIADAKVLASIQIPGTGEYDRTPVTTDARGRFRYQVLRPGHTIIEATAPGFAQSAPIAFRLAAGENRKGIVMVLHEATLSLQGYVFDAAGDPLPFVQVAQGRMGSKERFKKTYTNAHGYFAISGLGPGPHRLRYHKAGYKQVRVKDYIAPRSDIRIVMSPGR